MAKHGGAWKVAYADFITAMMALFMVLWILGTEEELLKEFQEYFRNPPSPFLRQSGKFPVDLGEYSGHSSEDLSEAFFERVDPAVLQNIVREFNRILNMQESSDRAPPVEITLTSDGLRMLIFDREDTPLFGDNSAKLTTWGDFLMQNLAWLISRYPFRMVIESHSGERDAAFAQATGAELAPWDLSVERSQEIRRQLQFYAAGDLEVRRVSGYGDSSPLEEGADRGRTHQRVSLSLSLAHEIEKENTSGSN